MDDNTIPTFSSPKEEIEYWRNLSEKYKQKFEESKEELEEFQISSHELESELETQLDQAEKKVSELTAASQRLQLECENLKDKLESSQNEYLRQINELQDELAQIKAIKEELQKYIRELEQRNDDLERSQRTTVVSLEDFEHRLNAAIERNAFLENELDEKETLEVTVQRLKDEARDMREELAVKEQAIAPMTLTNPLDNQENAKKEKMRMAGDTKISEIDNKVRHEAETNTTPHKDLTHTASGGGGVGNTPLTPSARISALNIVGDLLRKVGALESKLASCRNFVKDQQVVQGTTSRKPDVVESPRAPKRVNRNGSAGGGMVKITV
ncbi:nuclear distribution protein nudE-like 1 isoform X1 [Amphiura filiformis]|uniref:nuclear distribution protein nudE-like 1 isoform X1 n=1 Tax=Amphiura filiformis TaxID=82378 RepID=UPI003B20E494